MKSIVNQRSTKLIATILSLLLIFGVSSTAVLARDTITVYEKEPNDSISTATIVNYDLSQTKPIYLSGSIDKEYDIDFYKITLSKPQNIDIRSAWSGSYANREWEDDLYLEIYDANGEFIGAGVENVTEIIIGGTTIRQYEKQISWPLPAGTYYIGQGSNPEYDYIGQKYSTVIYTNPISVHSISVDKLPTKINYINGDKLDVDGGELFINTRDMGFADFTVPMSEATFSGFNSKSNTYGSQTVRVEYGGKMTSFTVYLNPFYDVLFAPKTHDFYYTIQNIASKGIMRGKGDGKYFGTADKLTRAEASVALVRAAGLEPARGSTFSDVPLGHWPMHILMLRQKQGY